MTTRYHFHEVIAEALNVLIETLIKKSIGERSLSFVFVNGNDCGYYLITNNGDKPIAVLYFDYEKLGFENRLDRFFQILQKLRLQNDDQIEACVFSIGLWGLTKFRDFKKNKTDFLISSYDHIIDTFKWYNFELDEDLSMDIDDYIRYQNLPEGEKIEIADVLLGSAQSSIRSTIQKFIKPQPQKPNPFDPSSDSNYNLFDGMQEHKH